VKRRPSATFGRADGRSRRSGKEDHPTPAGSPQRSGFRRCLAVGPPASTRDCSHPRASRGSASAAIEIRRRRVVGLRTRL